MKSKRNRLYRNVVAAVFNSIWAIMPDKLEEIRELIELRADGRRLTKEEIRERIGDVEQPQLRADFDSDPLGAQQSDVETTRIAVLNVFGTISQRMNAFMEFSGGTSTEQLANAFDDAIADESVAAVVLNVDSPGGSVAGVAEVADRIFAARGSKPIIAVANTCMCSAAYYIGSQADEIVAVPSATNIGNIGALTMHRETSKRDADAGVKYTIVKSVKNKAEGNSVEPLSESAERHMQSRVDAFHGKFLEAVARGRSIDVESIDERFGYGRSYPADDAVRLGLADRIATIETVFSELFAASPQSNDHSGRTTAAAQFSQEQGSMNPKVMAALVAVGMVKAGESDGNAEIALAAFLGLHKLQRPQDDEALAKLITDTATLETGSQANPQISPADIHAAVNLSPLNAEEKNTLVGELLAEGAELTYSSMLDRINTAAQQVEQPAGAAAMPTGSNVDAREKFAAAARDAMLVRQWGEGNLPQQIFNQQTGEYEEWKPSVRGNYGLQNGLKMAEQCLVVCGVPRHAVDRMAPMQIARLVMGADPNQIGVGGMLASNGPAYNVSGMFSNLLLDAQNVTLRRSYDDTRMITFKRWMRQAPSVADFKTVNRVIGGELGDPKAIPEDGEFEETTMSDSKESYKLTTWGRIFSRSWELIVSDQLMAFVETAHKMGRSMIRKQNRLAYQSLKDNAALNETSQNLFNATALSSGGHNNQTTGALTTVADYVGALNTMAQKMGEQKGLDDDSGVLNLMPVFVIYPMALRGIIRQTIVSVSSDTKNPGLANIWQNGLEPVEDGELGSTTTGGSDTAFYTACSNMDCDTVEYAYLQGLEAPVIEQATAFDSLALRTRIYQAFAVKPVDFRGMQKHTGA